MIKRINQKEVQLPVDISSLSIPPPACTNSTFSLPLRPITLPLVHLDLGETGQCASAIIGVMSQPTGDKICSLQVSVTLNCGVSLSVKLECCVLVGFLLKATNMAMRQVGVAESICDRLTDDLTAWLQHILASKVRTLLYVRENNSVNYWVRLKWGNRAYEHLWLEMSAEMPRCSNLQKLCPPAW